MSSEALSRRVSVRRLINGRPVTLTWPLGRLTATTAQLVLTTPAWFGLGRRLTVDRAQVNAVFLEGDPGLALGIDAGSTVPPGLRIAAPGLTRLRDQLAALGWPVEGGVRPGRLYRM